MLQPLRAENGLQHPLRPSFCLNPTLKQDRQSISMSGYIRPKQTHGKCGKITTDHWTTLIIYYIKRVLSAGSSALRWRLCRIPRRLRLASEL